MSEGLFDDTAVIRRVAGEGLLLAGGGRATLLQVAHPSVGQGVADHSNFAERPLDRLRTTMIYVYGVLFGTREEARRISKAVYAMHTKVTGPGYLANDPELQVWVNATLFDTAMLLYQRVFGPLSTEDADVCYRQYAVLATSIGCPEDAWPASRAEFYEYWEHMVSTLEVSDAARDIARHLMNGHNLPRRMRPFVPVNRFVTIGLLPAPIRAGYGYSWSPRQDRWLRRGLNLAAHTYPYLPSALRVAPKSYYLADFRKHSARSHPPVSITG